MRFSGKVADVTGGVSGIGVARDRRFHPKDVTVLLADFSDEREPLPRRNSAPRGWATK